MTVIAYRDNVLAGDTMVTVVYAGQPRETIYHENKIWRKKHHLFGAAGHNCPTNAELTEWFFGGRPKLADKYEFTLLVIPPEGRIETWDECGTVISIRADFWAIGSGQHLALGAMAAGATAVEAARIAAKWTPGIGGKIRKLTRRGK